MKTIAEPARQIPVVAEVDVVVAGGGPAGVVAATAAARNGARTVLVESHGFLGGIAALGIPFQGFHDDKNRRIVGGIAWEPIARLIQEGSSPGPWHFDYVARGYGAAIMYDCNRFRTIAADMVRDAGATLLLHTHAVSPVQEGDVLKGIIIESKAGRQAILANVVVDATGDGDMAARAGADFEQGNPQGCCQPVTVLFKIANIDMAQFLGYVDAHPDEFGLVAQASCLWRPSQAGSLCHRPDNPHYWDDYQKGLRRGIGGMKQVCLEAHAKGDYDMPNPLVAIACLPRPGEGIVNMALVKEVDSTDNRDLTRAETEGAGYVWKTMEFLRKYVPGFSNAWVSEIMPYVGIRESRRIVCDFTLDIPDMKACTEFDDRIAIAGRGVDIHDPTPDGSQPCGSMYTRFPDDYYIPYRCILPRGLENILLAGRCISVGYVAFGSTRVMGPCMAVGQAAGTAAAIAAREGASPRNIDVANLQDLLREQAAILDIASAIPKS